MITREPPDRHLDSRPTRLPATYLFVPGNRPDRFDKALASGADAIVLDLEDAVSPEAKDGARVAIGDWIGRHRDAAARIVVRVNAAGTAWFDADLRLLVDAAVNVAMLPKAEAAADIARVGGALGSAGRVIAMLETARGVCDVDALATSPQVQRLAFGTLDYAIDLGLSGDEQGLAYPSARIALASRAAGIGTPVCGVTAAIDDDAQLLADIAFGRAFGFGAKLCIHPRQVAVARGAFAPTPAEIAWATGVVGALRGNLDAARVDGSMVDRPVLQRARSILGRARDAGGDPIP
jgi:citrate lyase subunit beta/citryl-CoA lyase